MTGLEIDTCTIYLLIYLLSIKKMYYRYIYNVNVYGLCYLHSGSRIKQKETCLHQSKGENGPYAEKS